MSTEISKNVIEALQTGCIAFTTAMRSVDSAQAKADSKTDAIILVAIDCVTLKAWDNAIEAVTKIARVSKKAERTKLGFEQEKREDKGGNKYLFTFPNKYLAVVFSTIRQSLKRSLPLKSTAGVPLTFNQIKLNKASDIEKANKGATGRTKDKRDLLSLQKEQRARAKNYTDVDFHNFVNRLRAEVEKMPTSKAA